MLYTIEIKERNGDLHTVHVSDWESLMFMLCGILDSIDRVEQYRVSNHNGVSSARGLGIGDVSKLVTKFTWGDEE